MRILLAQNMMHVPSHGGANKSTRLLLESLAARGHECHVVSPWSGALRSAAASDLPGYLRSKATWVEQREAELCYELNGVRVDAVAPPRLIKGIRAAAERLDPDWILVPSDDPVQLALGASLRSKPERVVYLAHTLQQLPFGPRAFYQSESGTRMVQRCAGAISSSRMLQDYLLQWGGVSSQLHYPQAYQPLPTVSEPPLDGAVTMINPCSYKGISIFLALADALPATRFRAVPTWGTTEEDLAELRRRPNIELVKASDDIGEALAGTRVVVVPSLWDETFGLTVVDAMLRGIPVLASDVGGLVEAKLGVPYLLPVRPIERYDARSNPARPRAEIPEQDLDPWITTLLSLLNDTDHYAEISVASAAAAAAFVSKLDDSQVEDHLRSFAAVSESRSTDG